MKAPLAPCPDCGRHVRSDARACPFCDAPLDAATLTVVPDAPVRAGRAALFAFAASITAACASSQSTPPPPMPPPMPPPQEQTAQPEPTPPPMPAPPEDAGMMADDAGTPAEDAGTAMEDAGPPDTGARPRPRPRPRPPNNGGPMVRYGAPPVMD
ncbi:MAG: hypothetical protein R3A52_08860 [Polyangiales bacterium]